MKQLALAIGPLAILSDDFEDALRSSHLHAIEFSQGKLACDELPELELFNASARKMRTLHDAGLLQVPSLHIPFWPTPPWNLTSPDEAARTESVRIIRLFLKCFEGLDFHYITIHCGPEPAVYDPELRKVNIQQMKRTCQDLLPDLEKLDASLNLEFLPRFCIGNHEDELLEIVADLPAQYVNINIDVNHCMNRAAELPDIIRKCAPRIRAFHLSDYDGIDECHWQLGNGVLPWTQISDAIAELPDNVLLINETTPLIRKAKDRFPQTPLSVRFRSAEADFVRLLCAHEWDTLAAKVFPG